MALINYKVARVPGPYTEYVADVGGEFTVADALANANIALEGGEVVRLNGLEATSTSPVSDGQSIAIVKGAKGN